MLELNKIYNQNCLDTMAEMPNEFVDLVVTSPPYDNLREYKGYSFDFESVAKELTRILKVGGVIVWNVNDATINGSETGTSFRQALYFKDDCKMNLLDTMIWEKTSCGCLGSNNCYLQNFEYMFIFVKGKPKTFNPIKDRKNIAKPHKNTTNGGLKEGKGKQRVIVTKIYGKRTNIWKINQQQFSNHPAPFPEQLAADHIKSWSNENDIVYDPFMCSGTTAKMAYLLKRNFIGSEISKEYCDYANKRIKNETMQMQLF